MTLRADGAAAATLPTVPAFAALLAVEPTVVPVVVLGVATLAACGALVLAVGRRSGPDPAETAVAYEHAWDRLDFAAIWNLSSPRLRDGRSRDAFVRDKQAAYRAEPQLARLVRTVRPTQVDVNGPVARVLTRLELADGRHVIDEVLLERISGTWCVGAYSLATPSTR
ncbi:MAG: hypothetical protein ACRDY7_16990 [Acidimicrobiia bacterium]